MTSGAAHFGDSVKYLSGAIPMELEESPNGNGVPRDTSQEQANVSAPAHHEASLPSDRLKLFNPSSASSSSTPSSPSSSRPTTHKRTLSSSLFGKLNFLRAGGEDNRPPSREKEPASPRSVHSSHSLHDDEEEDDDDDMPILTSPDEEVNHSVPSVKALMTKNRKRKGSLRKTALLGGRRFMSEGRERRNSLVQRSALKTAVSPGGHVQDEIEEQRSKQATPETLTARQPSRERGVIRKFSYETVNPASSSSSSGWSEFPPVTAASLSLVTSQEKMQDDPSAHASGNKDQATTISSPSDPKSPMSYASTTEDDEDGLLFSRPSVSIPSLPSTAAAFALPPDGITASYFPSASPQHRSRDMAKSHPSPLQHAYAPPEPYSYTETEYWGWVILFVTWLLFTVGMGSCLEVWSWAWDVGETPYAPPELEDDPTLPIVGYYPALIVLTGVVAWVWITVAWVGMKYFRHAKIEV